MGAGCGFDSDLPDSYIGSSGRMELHISNQNDPFFWQNWVSVFYQDIIIAGIVRWSVVAVLGGFVIGILISFIYIRSREYGKKDAIS